jgi:hypothetical protein
MTAARKTAQTLLFYKKGGRLDLTMVSVFRQPVFQLAGRAAEVLAEFYRSVQDYPRPALGDLLTQGGNSYADLKLTIKMFGGTGRIDITPAVLGVGLPDATRAAGSVEAAKGYLAWCETTLEGAIEGIEISERLMRASAWINCEGGPEAVEAFLSEKGNAALRLDEGEYGTLKKEFTLQFIGVDASRAVKLGLLLQRSMGEGDLFVQFDYTVIGSPLVAQTVTHQFEAAEEELKALLLHVGLKQKNADG